MDLLLERNWLMGSTTIGTLFINGQFECFTLEDKIRNEKIYGETAIPYGIYNVVITYSPKFERRLPLLQNVPKFSGIRIHPGSSNKDTEGCVLVGDNIKGKKIYGSQRAFLRLYLKLEKAYDRGEKITFEVIAPDIKKGKGIIGVLSFIGLSIFGYKQFNKIKNENNRKHHKQLIGW